VIWAFFEADEGVATSRWIAFEANGKLQKIEVTGSQPQVLCPTEGGSFSGTWSRDGVILFSDSSRTIQRVSAAGGVKSQVLPLDESRKENSQIIPQFLPDGRRFLYESFGQQNGIVLGSLDGKSRLLMRSSLFAGGGSVGNHSRTSTNGPDVFGLGKRRIDLSARPRRASPAHVVRPGGQTRRNGRGSW
jgi:hypothetical protein